LNTPTRETAVADVILGGEVDVTRLSSIGT